MKRFIISILLIGLLFSCNAYGADHDGIMRHNQQIAEQWVNWRPDTWKEDTAVQILAEQFAAEEDGREQIPRAVYDWICENIYYDYDSLYSGTYSVLSAGDVLQERKGICEAIANLAQALLLESGIPCIKVWGATIEPGSAWEDTELDLQRVNHTWNEFYMNGRWVTMDCTADMNNRFQEGEFIYFTPDDDYFDPQEEFLALTHKRLYRGDDLPEDMVSEWAKTEVQKAVDLQVVSLDLLSDYRIAATENELRKLFGMENGDDRALQRWEAAVLISLHVEDMAGQAPYCDMTQFTDEVRKAADVLYQYGIMKGKGSDNFSPHDILTREEMICIMARIREMEAD